MVALSGEITGINKTNVDDIVNGFEAFAKTKDGNLYLVRINAVNNFNLANDLENLGKNVVSIQCDKEPGKKLRFLDRISRIKHSFSTSIWKDALIFQKDNDVVGLVAKWWPTVGGNWIFIVSSCALDEVIDTLKNLGLNKIEARLDLSKTISKATFLLTAISFDDTEVFVYGHKNEVASLFKMIDDVKDVQLSF